MVILCVLLNHLVLFINLVSFVTFVYCIISYTGGANMNRFVVWAWVTIRSVKVGSTWTRRDFQWTCKHVTHGPANESDCNRAVKTIFSHLFPIFLALFHLPFPNLLDEMDFGQDLCPHEPFLFLEARFQGAFGWAYRS